MDTIGQTMSSEILSDNESLFKACHVQPTPLKNGMVPLDIDVTPFDNSNSHKEGVSRTYKNYDGYAPIMAYIGTEGYISEVH
ncbi:MAG: IS1380 family transposase, partial [Eubacterium sp.]|nr:IS1380 family transposase [Eubacterium sp.]